ncbi:MAG: M24 family metallopeptidase, partial [Enterobacter hormaechei]|nr:M24 family metallopeptidase [Enterobacter hormaechei]
MALNEHASVLHYTKLDHQVPAEMRSFLLDAGAEYNGYAADLTRTWAANADTDFAQLIKDVNDEQLALIGTMKAGTSYVDYHIQFHQRIAKLLRKHQIIKDMSEEAMVENDLTGPFMPHGIGHPLGLQVHDVAGFMQDDTGTHLAAPSKYPYLRCTRVLAPRMVLTIEPGIYFAMNSPPAVVGADVNAVAATVSSWGFAITPEQLTQTAQDIGETTILARAGGAPTLAVGIAHILHQVLPGENTMAFWYHFAILFEALFILTAVDAGTRAGRFMLQDLLGNFVPALKKTESWTANIIGTGGCVALNEHASVLHYTKLDHQVPAEMRSFLLDAGA